MTTGVKISRRAAVTIIVVGIATTMGFLLACAADPPRQGFYGVSRWWNYNNGDINGEIGHRIFVKGPGAWCYDRGRSAGWNASTKIYSGQLPPGLVLNSNDDITGIPTDRGHWIVVLGYDYIECLGSRYRGFTQELRFHVKGTGEVYH